jgi:hypothetical protein
MALWLKMTNCITFWDLGMMYIISTLRLKIIGLKFEIENNRVFKKGWNLKIWCKSKGWNALTKMNTPHTHWLFGLSIVASPWICLWCEGEGKETKMNMYCFFRLALSQVQKLGMVLKFRAFRIKGIVPNFTKFEDIQVLWTICLKLLMCSAKIISKTCMIIIHWRCWT